MIPTEVRWRYNPPYGRQALPGGKQPVTQKNSCASDTNQACSDTTAQAQPVCQGSTNNCAWKPEWEIQDNAAFNFRPTAAQEVWFAPGKAPFSTAEAQRAFRRLTLRAMLNRGDQLILGFGVDAAFDSIGTAGTPNMGLVGQNYRGGHAVHLIGHVNTGNVTLDGVKYAEQNQGPLTLSHRRVDREEPVGLRLRRRGLRLPARRLSGPGGERHLYPAQRRGGFRHGKLLKPANSAAPFDVATYVSPSWSLPETGVGRDTPTGHRLQITLGPAKPNFAACWRTERSARPAHARRRAWAGVRLYPPGSPRLQGTGPAF
ncbi:hypothetical protein [Deinococcus hopiensis]|uniref:hypothetical protein n=1 Tax=Deinococcus hopiensis TaxID=309885 RepID=UPI000A0436D6|nr:hypothetical protein [Deinococcus hopiensis]